MDSTNQSELLEAFYSLSNKLAASRNTPVPIEGCSPLSAPSLHLLDVVGNHPGINNTQLADKLGITRSAVSQLSRKLTDKGFLHLEAKTGSEKEICFSLTENGWKAYRAHEKLHEDLYTRLSERLSQLEEKEIEDILLLMQDISECLDAYKHI